MRRWETWWKRYAPEDFPRRTTGTIDSPMRPVIVTEAEKTGGTVLDVGCATCIDYGLFKRTEVDYMGVDITEKFLNYAVHQYPEIEVCLGSILSLPFTDASFNTVYEKSVVEHVHPAEWGKAVSEMWRVAGEKAMFAFYLPPWDKAAEYFQHEEGFWRNRLNRAEFVDALRSLECFESLNIKAVGTQRLYVVNKG